MLALSSCTSPAERPPPNRERFDECSGVIVIKTDERWSDDASVKLYDDRAQVTYRAEFNRPDFDAIRENGPTPIAPLTFIRGTYAPEFRCTGASPGWFRVISVESESDPRTAFIARADRMFVWKSWSEYFLRRYIRFDRESNPLYARRGADVRVEPKEGIEHFYGTKVDGDWLQLEWKERSVVAGRNLVEQKSGWIKWRDEATDRVIAFPF